MAQLTDDCFAFGGALMPLADLPAFIESRVPAIGEHESVPLAAGLGRVAASDHRALIAIPSFPNSAVDGFAVRSADLDKTGETRLSIRGYVLAGAEARQIEPGSAVRIFTGAPMPHGADTVFMQEDCRVEAGHVVLPPGLKPGSNRRLAGEDIARDAIVIPKGRVLRPQDLALAAASGLSSLDVVRPLRVALFSTGNEIYEPGTALPPAGLYDANRPLLRAMLQRSGALVTDLGILRDDPAELKASLARAASAHDLILTSGGVSTGEADYVKEAVEAAGRLDQWRLAIKPGRPVAMGVLPRGDGSWCAFAGLPGNPVAAFVTFLFVIRPILDRLSGAPITARLTFPAIAAFGYRKKTGRREFVRVFLERDPAGQLVARKFPRDGAGVLSSLTETQGLAELPEDITSLAEGDTLNVIPYEGLL